MEHPDPKKKASPELTWEEKANLAEKRRKDTQAEITPLQQKVARLEAEKQVLTEQLQTPRTTLSEADTTRLDELLLSDPNAWRLEVNKLEDAARKQQVDDIAIKVEAKAAENLSEQEKAANRKLASSFFSRNTDLDPETFHKLVPVGLQEDLTEGRITVDEFLTSGAKLIRNAPVASQKAPGTPNLGATSGSSAPTEGARKAQSQTDWAKIQI